jgi:YesN/AraC family two-component response regulator
MLKIILAEDDLLVRNGIRMLLESDGSFQVIGEAANGTQVLELITGGLKPDVYAWNGWQHADPGA